MFVIKRADKNNWYVAHPSRRNNYTNELKNAHTFPTREAAEAELGPKNEVVVPLVECQQQAN